MPKFIPKVVFQTLILSLLLGCVLLVGYWFITNSGLYQWGVMWLGRSNLARGFSLFLAFLANCVGVLALAVGLRPFVQGLPSLRAQLQKDVDLLKAPGTLEEKLAQAQAQGAPAVSPRLLGFIFCILGVAAGLVTVITLFIADGAIYGFHLFLGLLSVGLLGAGLWQLITGKRFPTKK